MNSLDDDFIEKLISQWQYYFRKRLYDYMIYNKHLQIIRTNMKSKHVEITNEDWLDLAKSLED
jgi:hypothetical protein